MFSLCSSMCRLIHIASSADQNTFLSTLFAAASSAPVGRRFFDTVTASPLLAHLRQILPSRLILYYVPTANLHQQDVQMYTSRSSSNVLTSSLLRPDQRPGPYKASAFACAKIGWLSHAAVSRHRATKLSRASRQYMRCPVGAASLKHGNDRDPCHDPIAIHERI